MIKLPKKYFIIWIFLGYFALSLSIHQSFVKSFPHHIHAWAHCDHYALSKGFVNNGMDFFHPETYVYNKQFPNGKDEVVDSKTTSVDFPINNYVVAILFKVFNTDAPAVYRLYTLTVACIGLCFLFLISFHFVKDIVIAFLIPIIVVFTPIYLDYQVGFLPSTVALTLFFGSVYYFMRFQLGKSTKYWVITLVLLMLAAMIRTPFVIHLIALGGYLFVNAIAAKKVNVKIWGLWLGAFILPIVYFWYNTQLRNEYGSIFLGSPMLVKSWEQVGELLEDSKTNWSQHFLNSVQYYIFITVKVVLFSKLMLKRIAFKGYVWSFIVWISISILGVLAYSFLMLPQFVHHDYYFIDTFYPVIFIVLVWVLSNIKYYKFIKFINIFILLTTSFLIISKSSDTLTERRSVNWNDAYANQYKNYQNLASFLSENGVDKNEKIFVIDSYAPNMSFLLSEYSGYALIKRNYETISEAMHLNYKYAVVSTQYFFAELYTLFPEITQYFNCISMNQGLILLEKKSNFQNGNVRSLGAFLKLNDAKRTINLKEENLENANYFPNSEEGHLNHEMYGMTYRFEISPELSYTLIRLSGKYKVDSKKTSVVHVIDTKEQENNVFYQALPFENLENKFNEYIEFEKFVLIPAGEKQRQVTVFLYNPNQEEFYYKNLKIDFY
jgi:hypothetical protein